MSGGLDAEFLQNLNDAALTIGASCARKHQAAVGAKSARSRGRRGGLSPEARLAQFRAAARGGLSPEARVARFRAEVQAVLGA